MASRISCSAASAVRDLETGEGAHRRDGFEIQRIGHGERERRFRQRHGIRAALAQEALREAFDFGRGRRRPVHRDQRQAELVGKRRQHVALGDEAHVDENLAQLVAALVLQFERAFQVFGFDLACARSESRPAAW